jgi:uncharacterized protein YeaO (DUF488 family)
VESRNRERAIAGARQIAEEGFDKKAREKNEEHVDKGGEAKEGRQKGDEESAVEAMIRIVRLGSPRAKNEGPRLGTVRRPPRGVPKAEFATRDYYDVWLPELAPSRDVVAAAMSGEWTDKRWQQFVRTYRREMRQPAALHLIATLAALSHQANFSLGCYCEDAARCHRSVLRELLIEATAEVD